MANSPPPEVEVSRPDKLLWASSGITKRHFVDYLGAVSDHMLPWVRQRPMTLVRAPDGVGGKQYFQKAVPTYAPEWIRTVRIPAPSAGRDVDFVVCENRATLQWLGNQAALELHPAPVRVDMLDRPDLLVVDIDPPEGAFDAAVEVALMVLDVLDDLGVSTGIKTTGGKGLHVVAPIERRYEPEEFRQGRGAADRDRRRTASRAGDRRVPQGEAGGPGHARSVPQRHGRHDRRAVLTAGARGGDRVVPRDAGRAVVGITGCVHDLVRAGSPRPTRTEAMVRARVRAPPFAEAAAQRPMKPTPSTRRSDGRR